MGGSYHLSLKKVQLQLGLELKAGSEALEIVRAKVWREGVTGVKDGHVGCGWYTVGCMVGYTSYVCSKWEDEGPRP